jgi:hypothetical protein
MCVIKFLVVLSFVVLGELLVVVGFGVLCWKFKIKTHPSTKAIIWANHAMKNTTPHKNPTTSSTAMVLYDDCCVQIVLDYD